MLKCVSCSNAWTLITIVLDTVSPELYGIYNSCKKQRCTIKIFRRYLLWTDLGRKSNEGTLFLLGRLGRRPVSPTTGTTFKKILLCFFAEYFPFTIFLLIFVPFSLCHCTCSVLINYKCLIYGCRFWSQTFSWKFPNVWAFL